MAKKLSKIEKAIHKILDLDSDYEISITMQFATGNHTAFYEVEVYEWTTGINIESKSVADSVKTTIEEATLDVLQQLQEQRKLK